MPEDFKYFANLMIGPSTKSEEDGKSQPASRDLIVPLTLSDEEMDEIRRKPAEDCVGFAETLLLSRAESSILSGESCTCFVCNQRAKHVVSTARLAKYEPPKGGAGQICHILYDKTGTYLVCSSRTCHEAVQKNLAAACPHVPSYQVAKTNEECRLVLWIRDQQFLSRAEKCTNCEKVHDVPINHIEADEYGHYLKFYCSTECHKQFMKRIGYNGCSGFGFNYDDEHRYGYRHARRHHRSRRIRTYGKENVGSGNRCSYYGSPAAENEILDEMETFDSSREEYTTI